MHEALLKRALELESSPPQDVVAWAVREYAPRLAFACSFGSVSDMMLFDLIARSNRSVAFLYIDTEVLFPETYDLIARVRERYGITPQTLKFRQRPPDELWLTQPDDCCHLRKVAPLKEALAGYQGWITGLRRDQGGGRRHTPIVGWDDVFGLVKVNPMANMTEDEAWAYVREH
ncbi:MAG TPA: phosphoadenosine phosphosulfate reductase family protein, partial [Candidatus Xenobia bacterium]